MTLTDLYELRDDVYRRPLITAVQRIGLGPGWKVADLGAGNGDVSVALAAQVGRTGRVYAVDIDPLRRNEIATKASLFSQVVAVTQAVEELALPEKVDLVFARFLLLGIDSPKLAVSKMIESVRKGGWIVVQEPITSAGRIDLQALSTDTLVIKWPDIGVMVPKLLADAGVVLTDMWAESPVGYGSGPEVDYLYHMTEHPLPKDSTVVLPPLVTVVGRCE